jgi:hypothetical protein
MTYEQASSYSEPFSILVKRVKPYRDALTGQIHEKEFWKFWDKRKGFFERVRGFGRILACPSTSKYLIMTFIDEGWVPSHSIKLFSFNRANGFAVFQSTFHEAWVREQSGKLEQRLAYNLTRAFATFPWPSIPVDYSIADQLYDVRNSVGMDMNICLTDVYNAVHDPSNNEGAIKQIRELHRELDDVVAAGYGWDNIRLDRGFHPVPFLPENDRVRFTVAEPARLEILRRLAALNDRQHKEQQTARASSGNRVGSQNRGSLAVVQSESDDSLFKLRTDRTASEAKA